MLRRCVSLAALLAYDVPLVGRLFSAGQVMEIMPSSCGGAVDKSRLRSRTHNIIDVPCVGQNMVHVANAVSDEDQRQRFVVWLHFCPFRGNSPV